MTGPKSSSRDWFLAIHIKLTLRSTITILLKILIQIVEPTLAADPWLVIGDRVKLLNLLNSMVKINRVKKPFRNEIIVNSTTYIIESYLSFYKMCITR